ncbi:HD-GYP domain-containing protein [Botrimarina sp.]|uniref:HD-GYP domain-containing protein n=1 Tax=Botrimarina sp. TaxID=2795802 RepID=UPI0032EF8A20
MPTATTLSTAADRPPAPHVALAEHLAAELDQPAWLFRRSGEGERPWAAVALSTDHPTAPEVPSGLLDAAYEDGWAVDAAEQRGPFVAARLAENAVFATHGGASPEWLARYLAAEVARKNAAAKAAMLQDENDSFAAQLTSDLEELTFLRSMVAKLSASRPDTQLGELIDATLPVLNASIRTECLAYLKAPDPASPFRVTPEWVGGPSPLPDPVLLTIVERLGPAAKERTLVRNWPNRPGSAIHYGAEADRIGGVDSVVLTPLECGPRFFGWLAAVNRLPAGDATWASPWQLSGDEFGTGEASLLATTASVIATHAANLELLREKELLIVSVVKTIVSAIESKDQYTRGHSDRVARYARRLALELGYNDAEADELYLTALLHDVGKIGVRDAVLQKPGRLTDEEFAEIARHPDEGWAILSGLRDLAYVLPGVLHHHERWDGGGYPDGLQGEAIPRDGRVLAVVDAFDAMTSDRPYRSGMPVEKAAAIIREGAGSQWDERCVAAFMACFDDILQIKREYKLPERVARRSLASGALAAAPE